MKILSFLLILLFLVPDLTIRFQIQDTAITMKFCTVFLFFHVMRHSLIYCSFLLFFYSVVAAPFTALDILQIFTAHFLVFLIFSKMMDEIYTETYIVQAFWVFFVLCGIDAFNLLIGVIGSGEATTILSHLAAISLNNLVSAAISVPFLLILDHLYKFVNGNPYDSKWTRNSYILDKGSPNDLM